MAEVLTHRNYLQAAQSNLELIRGDLWDFEFSVESDWPKAVYFPGEQIWKTRLKTATINMANSAEVLSKEIFVTKINQNAGRDIQTGSVSFSFIDREDQAITYMANDWLNQIGDPYTGFGRHKSELMFNTNCIFYDTLLVAKRRIKCDAGFLNSADIPETPGEKGSDLSEVSITVDFQLLTREML